jgi:hypothetical protein
MELADQDKFDFDPLDVTKVWPEHLFPLHPVGRMVLNKNIDNFFNENEQLAFCPALVVPGAPRGRPAGCPCGLPARREPALPPAAAGLGPALWLSADPPPTRPQASPTATTSCCRRASSATRTRSATAWAPTT